MAGIKTIILAVLVIISMSVNGQDDFPATLAALQEKYSSADNMRIRMRIEAYPWRGSDQSFYKEDVLIEKSGTAYRYQLKETEMLMNDRFTLVVDHTTRRITMRARDVKGEINFQRQVSFHMDSILRIFPEGTYDGLHGINHQYVVHFKEGEISKMDLFISKESQTLTAIHYSYRTGQWVKIEFDEFELSPFFERNEFDESIFVNKTESIWAPSSTLSGYSIQLTK